MSYATRTQILEALKEHGGGSGVMTYVLRNILNAPYYRWSIRNLETSTVRRQLERMERSGFVKKVPSSYSRQICWALTELGQTRAAGDT